MRACVRARAQAIDRSVRARAHAHAQRHARRAFREWRSVCAILRTLVGGAAAPSADGWSRRSGGSVDDARALGGLHPLPHTCDEPLIMRARVPHSAPWQPIGIGEARGDSARGLAERADAERPSRCVHGSAAPFGSAGH